MIMRKSEKKDFSTASFIEYPVVDIERNAIGYPKVIQKVVDGKIVNSVEFVIDDGSQENYRVDDFALENLLAAGVDLKECKFNSGSLLNADNVASMAEEVSKLRESNVQS